MKGEAEKIGTGQTAAVKAVALDLAALRQRLAALNGQQYWRSLEEATGAPEFREMFQREFPVGAAEWWDGLDRRSFLKMAVASLALGGLTACTKQRPLEILPYVQQPRGLVPGEPLFYATTMTLGGYASGVLAKSYEGHPVKLEGNPEHPATLGGSSVWMQASILDLYDPDRSQTVTHEGELSTWALFLSELNQLVGQHQSKQGKGLWFLTETVTSPSLAAQFDDLLKRFPEARWHQYESVSRDNVREGARLAFGEVVEPQYRFEKAAVILSLESDFLFTHPLRLRYAREFINGRRVSSGKNEMSRLYVVESTPSVTGTMADHRLASGSANIEALTRRVARELGVPQQNDSALPSATEGAPVTQWIRNVVRDLGQHRGRSIVIAGEWQPPLVHAFAHQLNELLGNVGSTVFYTEPAEAHPESQVASLRELVQAMEADQVETLFILGGNPAYTAPADLRFADFLPKLKRSVYLGLDRNETAALCTWHIPQAHYLESWGDARSADGTVSLMQPLIAPLYDGKSAHEVLGAFIRQQPVPTDYEVVREHWRAQNRWPDFERGWRQALHDGFIAGSEAPPKNVRVRHELGGPAAGTPGPVAADEIEVCFRPDPHLWDGRFANNGWLQECPKPISKMSWDNALLVSPKLAESHKLKNGDVVELRFLEDIITGPIWIMPGQAINSITAHLGYGRLRIGRVGSEVGFNAGVARRAEGFWNRRVVSLVKTPGHHQLATTQNQHQIDSAERQIYRAGTLQDFVARPELVKDSVEQPLEGETLYNPNEYPYTGYKWGMSIDLGACIGCNACVLACEVENNIPVVGKEQILRGRDMLWLRVDTYFQGSLDNPSFNHMPVPCMHCEHAPCELVCPVEATVHDHEGLNLQVYNRCVGTRFCSNNCPYKVRRFNFFQYAKYDQPSYHPRYNPEVSVRWRGVMEKCTYCIQRIASARITAEKENRRIREGEVRSACQQACPTEAIVFGDLNDPESKAARLKKHPLDYSMLGQLNTRPRTTYLAKLTNPNGDTARV